MDNADIPYPPAGSVESAPGRGIEPAISAHTQLSPALYRLDEQPIEQLSPLVQRQFLHGTQSTVVKWTVKKGGAVPLHHHTNEQMNWITKGECEVYSQGTKYTLRAGDIMVIPPNVPHEFVFTEDTIDIDIFAPQRQDWIDGTAGYYSEK